MRRMIGRILIVSADSPLLEIAITISFSVTMPRSPWNASAGCRKNDGVPVLANVAAILRAICPDLPMPVTMTRAGQSKMHRTTFTNSSFTLLTSFATASDSSFSVSTAFCRIISLSMDAVPPYAILHFPINIIHHPTELYRSPATFPARQRWMKQSPAKEGLLMPGGMAPPKASGALRFLSRTARSGSAGRRCRWPRRSCWPPSRAAAAPGPP